MTRHPVTLRVGIVYATLIAVATLWGAATGLLVPRAAYRLSVVPEEAWRETPAPAGIRLPGRAAAGWVAHGARCVPLPFRPVRLRPAPLLRLRKAPTTRRPRRPRRNTAG